MTIRPSELVILTPVVVGPAVIPVPVTAGKAAVVATPGTIVEDLSDLPDLSLLFENGLI